MHEEMEKSIISTIAFFDLFNKPLGVDEIWQYLNIKCEKNEVENALNKCDKYLSKKNGLYFLKNREVIVDDLNKQIKLSKEKLEIVQRAVKKLRYINGVRMVALCNNIFYKKESDVDVFIVTSAGRIWLTRFLVTLVVHLMGIRRYGFKIADRICLSFYVSEDNLNLKNIGLDYDPYFYYWLALLLPVYDNNTYDNFWQANHWIEKFLPNLKKKDVMSSIKIEDNIIITGIKKINNIWFYSFLGKYLEKILKKIQKNKMNKNINSVSGENDTRVIISDVMLKFHEQDRREEYRDKFVKKIRQILE